MSRASFRDLFVRFYGFLESCNSRYFAYGGVAVAVWGDPRETQDVDAVVTLSEQDVSALLDRLLASGFVATSDQARTFPIDGWIRLTFQGRHADLSLGRTPFDASAFERRKRAKLFDLDVWLASAEDLVLYKLISYRYKDLADAESVLVRQGKSMDLNYLRHWAAEITRHTLKFEVPQKLEELLGRVGSL